MVDFTAVEIRSILGYRHFLTPTRRCMGGEVAVFWETLRSYAFSSLTKCEVASGNIEHIPPQDDVDKDYLNRFWITFFFVYLSPARSAVTIRIGT